MQSLITLYEEERARDMKRHTAWMRNIGTYAEVHCEPVTRITLAGLPPFLRTRDGDEKRSGGGESRRAGGHPAGIAGGAVR